MLYNAEVYDPTLDMGRDQYSFYFHFDEYAPRRWSSDHARHIRTTRWSVVLLSAQIGAKGRLGP
jgi:hypothetical protein